MGLCLDDVSSSDDDLFSCRAASQARIAAQHEREQKQQQAQAQEQANGRGGGDGSAAPYSVEDHAREERGAAGVGGKRGREAKLSAAGGAGALSDDEDDAEARTSSAGGPPEGAGGSEDVVVLSDDEQAVSPRQKRQRESAHRRGDGGGGNDDGFHALPRAGTVAANDGGSDDGSDREDTPQAELDDAIKQVREEQNRRFQEVQALLDAGEEEPSGDDEDDDYGDYDEEAKRQTDSDIEEIAPPGTARVTVNLVVQLNPREKLDLHLYSDEPFEKVVSAVAKHKGWGSCALSFDGDRIAPTDTPQTHDIEDGDIIEAREG